MIFPELNAPLRTDAAFRARIYEGHHKNSSILESVIGLDMIKDFPIGDALHLIDLGITKRLLIGWKTGSLHNPKARWSAAQIQGISDFLITCKMPTEIRRPLRELEHLNRWKGTEYRTFLLYVSVIVVNNFFSSKDIYEHFLHFFCAIQICSRQKQSTHNYQIAKSLLSDFLNGVKIMYGEHMFCSNMHNLIHLVDDVERFGPLGSFDAYPFESKLYCIKNMLRSGHLPLSQVAKRLIELQKSSNGIFDPVRDEPELKFPLELNEAPQNIKHLIAGKQIELYACLKLRDFTINSKYDADSWIITKQKAILKIIAIVQNVEDGKVLLAGNTIENQCDYFKKPILSSSLLIYGSNLKLSQATLLPLDQIYSKMVLIETKDKNLPNGVFLPLIHTMI